MAALRFLAFLFLVFAIIALVSDLTPRTGVTRPALFTSVSQQWNDMAPSSMATAQKLVRNGAHPIVWDVLFRPLLALPTWLFFAAIGGTFGYLGRRRRRVQIFTN
jgi:hypothetical protein